MSRSPRKLRPRLDPDDLRSYAGRDWSAPERLARRERARLPVASKVRLAIALYEAAAGGATERERRADLDSHLRVRALLDRAADVGAR